MTALELTLIAPRGEDVVIVREEEIGEARLVDVACSFGWHLRLLGQGLTREVRRGLRFFLC
ncbi:hypothetical protein [Rhizobium sp. CCGE 510]|uniref:hypothetical protein n=1 Tax=Rhizobium sp. CCGE 510 TaxID=1132836 RepID=UPI0003051098|nr:hypothetical protein [Rhizobium sp. CCGE 510]